MRKHKFSHRIHKFKPDLRVRGFFDSIKVIVRGMPCKTCGLNYKNGKHR